MKLKVLTEKKATTALKQLIETCSSYSVTVAWAGANEVVNDMLGAKSKLWKMVIGTHMYQTDPAVLRLFSECQGARCLPPSGRLFHPKLYYFEMPDGYAAVVGSHNLTGGAFGGKNIELSTLLQGTAKDNIFEELRCFINSSWDSAEDIHEGNFLFSYEAQYRANKDKLRELNKFHRLKKPRSGIKVSTFDLTWASFVHGVKSDGHHNLDGRLAVLERAASLFFDRGSFEAMLRPERKAIAGTFGVNELGFEDLDWAWFGGMSGQGDFKNLVNESPRMLSKALDRIPSDGKVSEDDFEAFSKCFNSAFRNKTHRGGIATASRLLVMKRPDFFVGVNDANKRGICGAFGAAHTTLTLDNYWERIMAPIQNSPWWLAPRPRSGLAARIWDNRAALLDSIYYEPN
ncbi:phospholipase D family protein [Pseudomonas fitomaticsae]|uniref:Phospholipase D family protein n=1 Tax=Pseudomonas fitomaticsae TaxID=2837969 RepID=A0ABY3PUU5_9PSED|nr:phospholipase D family protein [Pseudomonas fitomaticsae]UFP97703.1 phospholipase D family protein [Pseudomonas fitomaticsae]